MLKPCAVILLAAFAVCVPSAAFAQDEAHSAVEIPAEDRLEILRQRAEEVFTTSSPDAQGNRAILAAWSDLEDASRAVQPDHRLIGYAQIKQASQLYLLGRNAEAQTKVDAGLAALPTGDASFLPVRGEGVALLGTILAQSGDADEAIGALRDGYAVFMAAYNAEVMDEPGRSLVMAKSNLEFSLSQVLLRLSQVDEALAFQKASLDTRESAFGPNDPDTVASYYGYAGTLRRAGRMAEAETFARTAVTRAVDHVDPAHPSYARALEMLAIVLSRSGRPIEATGYLTRALELKREHEGADNLFFGYGIHQLGTILHQRERYAEAVPLFAEAHPIFAKYQGEDSPFGLGSLAYAGQDEFALGRTATSVERLSALNERFGEDSRDLEIVQRIGPDLARGLKRLDRVEEARAIAASIYGRLLLAEGSDPFDLRHMRLVRAWVNADGNSGSSDAAMVDEARTMLAYLERASVTDLGGFLQTEQRAALDLIMEIAVTTGDLDLLASAMATSSVSGISRATQLQRQRALTDDPEVQAAIRALQNADAQLEAADRALLGALANGEGVATARAALTEAEAQRAAALAELESRNSGWQDRPLATNATVAGIRANLAPEEALMALIPAYDGAYALLVTQSGAIGRRIAEPRAQLVEQARLLRDSAVAAQFNEAAAMSLGKAFFSAETIEALRDVQVIRVLAGGPFASVPFAMLQTVAGDGDEAKWLSDRFALVNVASFDPAVRRPGNAPLPATGSFVAFAAPTPFGERRMTKSASSPAGEVTRSLAAYFQADTVDTGALAELPPLPEAEREARTLAASFPGGDSTVFVGAQANEARLGDDRVAKADVLLFATHGLVAGEVEGIAEPALVLASDNESGADGVLTATEIARLDLSADWIILTACDSAAGFGGGLPAFSGLARAFRFAGGGSLLATHWKVRDDAAAYVAINAMRNYRENGNKAIALQHAIRMLRDESGLPGAKRPDVWAPFVLID